MSACSEACGCVGSGCGKCMGVGVGVSYQGHLFVKSSTEEPWRRCFFVLYVNGTLSWHTNEAHEERFEVKLGRGARVEMMNKHLYGLRIELHGKALILSAENANDFTKWRRHLQQATADASPVLSRHTVCGKEFIVDARYKELKAVGQGAYGVVASCVDTLTEKTVAIKKISHLFCDAQDTKRIIREIRLMSSLQHPNILGLIDVIGPSTSHSDDVYIVSELMATDLYKMIKFGKPLTAEHQQAIMYQLMLGIDHLHASGIVHRDLKPRNILLSRRCEVKICDFGLARLSGEVENRGDMTEYTVTRWYRAPEIMLNPRNYGTKVDIWSAGCIFAEMQLSEPLFRGNDCLHQLKIIFKLLGNPSNEDMKFVQKPASKNFLNKLPKYDPIPLESILPNMPADGHALLERMLALNPDTRISARESLTTIYFENLKSEELEGIPRSVVKADDIEACPLKVNDLRILMADEISRLKHRSELVASNENSVAPAEHLPHCQSDSRPQNISSSQHKTNDALDDTHTTVSTCAPTRTCSTKCELESHKFSITTWREWPAMCCVPCLLLYGLWKPIENPSLNA